MCAVHHCLGKIQVLIHKGRLLFCHQQLKHKQLLQHISILVSALCIILQKTLRNVQFSVSIISSKCILVFHIQIIY